MRKKGKADTDESMKGWMEALTEVSALIERHDAVMGDETHLLMTDEDGNPVEGVIEVVEDGEPEQSQAQREAYRPESRDEEDWGTW